MASSKITVEEWFKTWMEQYKVNQVKIGTVVVYNNCYNRYIKDALGTKKLTEIRGEHIQKLYNDMIKKDFSHTTIRLVSATLSGCFKQAMKNGLIERNPVPLVTLSKAKPKESHRVLTKEEQDIFMEYAKGSYLYNLFALAVRTGLRGGELRGLKLSDEDKAASLLHIQRTLKYASGRGFFEDTPKTATSKRDIPLTKDMIDRVVKRINADGIEFERFTPHCFRHTFATRAIESGMKPQTLKTILGHASLSMTMDLYSHVLPTTRAEEMELIAKAF